MKALHISVLSHFLGAVVEESIQIIIYTEKGEGTPGENSE